MVTNSMVLPMMMWVGLNQRNIWLNQKTNGFEQPNQGFKQQKHRLRIARIDLPFTNQELVHFILKTMKKCFWRLINNDVSPSFSGFKLSYFFKRFTTWGCIPLSKWFTPPIRIGFVGCTPGVTFSVVKKAQAPLKRKTVWRRSGDVWWELFGMDPVLRILVEMSNNPH
jgi:hypothetical protein